MNQERIQSLVHRRMPALFHSVYSNELRAYQDVRQMKKPQYQTFMEISCQDSLRYACQFPAACRASRLSAQLFLTILTTSSPFISVSMTSLSSLKNRCLKKCSRKMVSLYPKFALLVLLTLGNSVSSVMVASLKIEVFDTARLQRRKSLACISRLCWSIYRA